MFSKAIQQSNCVGLENGISDLNQGSDKCLVIDLIKKHDGDMSKVTEDYYECWKESKEE